MARLDLSPLLRSRPFPGSTVLGEDLSSSVLYGIMVSHHVR